VLHDSLKYVVLSNLMVIDYWELELSIDKDNVWIHMFKNQPDTNSIVNPCRNWACILSCFFNWNIVIWLQWQQPLSRFPWLPNCWCPLKSIPYYYKLKYFHKCSSFIYSAGNNLMRTCFEWTKKNFHKVLIEKIAFIVCSINKLYST